MWGKQTTPETEGSSDEREWGEEVRTWQLIIAGGCRADVLSPLVIRSFILSLFIPFSTRFHSANPPLKHLSHHFALWLKYCTLKIIFHNQNLSTPSARHCDWWNVCYMTFFDDYCLKHFFTNNFHCRMNGDVFGFLFLSFWIQLMIFILLTKLN